jgi:hypothetical protein
MALAVRPESASICSCQTQRRWHITRMPALPGINSFALRSRSEGGLGRGASVGTERNSVRGSADMSEGRKAGSELRVDQSLAGRSTASACRSRNAPLTVQPLHSRDRGATISAPRLEPTGTMRRSVSEQLIGKHLRPAARQCGDSFTQRGSIASRAALSGNSGCATGARRPDRTASCLRRDTRC